MKRHTSATPANQSRSSSSLTKRQRRKATIVASFNKAVDNFMKGLDTRLTELIARMEANNVNPDPTYYDEKEEIAFEAAMKEIQSENDLRYRKKRRQLSLSGRGRKLLAKRDAKIEAWAERIANDVADLTD